MARLKYHSNMWLRDDLAKLIDQWEDANGVLPITSAGRTEAEQNEFIRLWDLGPGKRPSWLFKPWRPAKTAPHVVNGGEAIDVSPGAQRTKFINDPNAPFYRNIPDTDPVHFVPKVNWSPSNGVSEKRKQEQAYLNARFGANLVVDGRDGPATRAAVAAYQGVLGIKQDGKWGPETQKAHQAFYDREHAPKPAKGLPGHLRWYGVQRMLKALHGYQGEIDNRAGDGTMSAYIRFLQHRGFWDGDIVKSTQRWLAQSHGYKGKIDGDWGPLSDGAWKLAENRNWNAFPKVK